MQILHGILYLECGLRFALSLSLTSQIPVQNFAKLDFCLWGLYYESHQHQNLHMQSTNDTLQNIGWHFCSISNSLSARWQKPVLTKFLHVIAYLTKLFFKRDFSEMVSRRDMVLTAFDGEVPEDP